MHTVKITKEFKDLQLVEALAKEAFPPKEYLATKKLIEMAEDGSADFLAVYDENEFVGFVFIRLFENMCYLFFCNFTATSLSRIWG